MSSRVANFPRSPQADDVKRRQRVRPRQGILMQDRYCHRMKIFKGDLR
jgi:hypothetical protein